MMLKIVIELGIQYPIVQLPHTHRRFISIIMDTICQNSKSVKPFDFKFNPGFNPKVIPSYVETVKSSKKDNYIFYDEKAETENGFPIVHGMMVDEDHHDVLSTLDQYINSDDEYTVRVRFDEDDYMYIEFQLDDGIIEIDENGWYVA